MSNTFKIIYSTLAVVMVVNSFVFALPIVANAQAIEKQQIEQIQLTATQKAELEKAQKEARLAMYKELKLSTAEIKFVEKYTSKMELFSQAIDKHVNYNKKNGNATVDVMAIYKNMKAIRTATGLTQNEVLTVKDIALKMVRNYNRTVDSIVSKTVPAQKANLSKGIAQDVPETKVVKTLLDRGVKVENYLSSEVGAKSLTVGGKNAIEFYWNGYKMYINGNTVNTLLNNGVSVAIGLIVGCALSSLTLCTVALAYAIAYGWWVYNYNIDCGRRGVFLEAQYWHWNFPVVKKVC